MKHAPVLESVYARVDILDISRANGSFNKIASIFMLGEANRHVKNIDDFNVKNKKLVSALGVDTIRALIDTPTPIRGGADEWDELDDMDFEELLNAETIVINDQEKVDKKNASVTGNHFNDFELYTTDKAADIRQKVAMATKIDPYKQYIWIPSVNKSMNGDSISMINHWSNSLRIVNGYPIDGHSTSDISFQPSVRTFAKSSAVVLYCISLDSIILDKAQLQFLARSDSESYELIHKNTIQYFYPMVTLGVFNQYLSDESLVKSKFESCEFDIKDAIAQYNRKAKIVAELNKEKKVTIDSSDLLMVTTTGMTLFATYGDYHQRVNTTNLFQQIDISLFDSVSSIDLFCINGGMRSVRLRKLQQKDQFRIVKDESISSFGTYSKNKLIQSRSMILTLLPRDEFDLLKIIIDQFGSSMIIAQPNQTRSFSKAGFLEFVSPIVDTILNLINSNDSAFTSHEKYHLLKDPVKFQYQFPSSSSKLTFMFPISYNKLLDMFIDKLLSAAFVKSINNENSKRNNPITSFSIYYGVSSNETTGQRQSSIDVRNINSGAIVVLSNMDVDETNLYVDIIGRLILASKSSLIMPFNSKSNLNTVDPVLFRMKVTSDGYSRICQRKFQPVVTTADDSKSVEYYNFTFQRPEYYSCPTKDAPVLGFIKGKHEQGYCLPCCRKTKQPKLEQIKKTCIQNESKEEFSFSTYKIDYPIPDIPNSKIMNRRISLPPYISQILGIQNAVANGTILASHGEIRDGMDPSTKSYLQTAIIISAIDNGNFKPIYKSHREFILDVIAMIKQPLMQVNIMRYKLIADRYATPQDLVHAIEDCFIKESYLNSTSVLSAVEWNDLIIFLANSMGLNVLLLTDERVRTKGLQLANLYDIDVAKPVLILLRRTNIEWSSRNHNTRAVYLPITSTSFKVLKISTLVVPKFSISKTLSKLRRVTFGNVVKTISKQLTIDKLHEMAESDKTYKLLEDMSDQKLAAYRINKNFIITTVSTMKTTIKPINTNMTPTSPLKDLLMFITDYNMHFLNDTTNITESLSSYKVYLQLALKSTTQYEFIDTNAFVLKIHKFITYDSMVIGAVVNVININKIVCTELMFMKPTSLKTITNDLKQLQSELSILHKRLNLKAIISFPIATSVLFDTLPHTSLTSFDNAFLHWETNPLNCSQLQPNKCKLDLRQNLNEGTYMSEIYKLYCSKVIEEWTNQKSLELDNFIIDQLKKIKSLPIVETKIDNLINDIVSRYSCYDPAIVRHTITTLFDDINKIDKTISDATTRIKKYSSFNGFELKNVHRLTKTELKSKIETLTKEIGVKSAKYPEFNLDQSISSQSQKFYDKNKKLIIQLDIYPILVESMVSDLSNPFRRDYIIHQPLIESSFIDIRPHIGELIYVQLINN